MIVTRSWLNEFIDLSNVTNEKLYETFNSIGLEVDSINKIDIPAKVVVGKILSCEKHPDADKLNVCQIDVGSSTVQIVCGAANVVDAEYVAVATVGSVLPGDFKIKDAKLRGVDSAGMVCSSTELGLPEINNGIMILDDSIGELIPGNELNTYDKVADTIIELELTANRGDCLSVYGVARDLSSALDLKLKVFDYKQEERMKLGIAREAEICYEGEMDADLYYKLASLDNIRSNFLVQLRLAIINVSLTCKLEKILAYTTHTTGVILRAYDSRYFSDDNSRISVQVKAKEKGIMEIRGNGDVVSVVGVYQTEDTLISEYPVKMIIEASYINPDTLVEAVFQNKLKTDDLYYKTSRGSNPDLKFGLRYLAYMLERDTELNCYEGTLSIEVARNNEKIFVDHKEMSAIIGMPIDTNKIITILQKLGFDIVPTGNNTIAVTVPLFRHDIKNIQDISEEIVRIIGINNIEAKALLFSEKLRLNSTTDRYKAKKALKHQAVGVGFYENVSYTFSDRVLLEKYDFPTVNESLDLANPIAEELNTLRSTILVNLLLAAKRNVSYSKKSIPLFEIGEVFGSKREQSTVMSFVFSGYIDVESVVNAGKPALIDFATFTQKLSAIIGSFELLPCTYENGLIHPYQSADVMIDGKKSGFISKLHPVVAESFGLSETFIAEIDFEALMPKHINAKPISKFQGVYKDLSVVIDKSLSYYSVATVLNSLNLPMLKDIYPVDIYVDEKLGDKKSLTIRFFIQSMERTLEDGDIESVMSKVMNALETECEAELR